jgi:hypothetical protein
MTYAVVPGGAGTPPFKKIKKKKRQVFFAMLSIHYSSFLNLILIF